MVLVLILNIHTHLILIYFKRSGLKCATVIASIIQKFNDSHTAIMEDHVYAKTTYATQILSFSQTAYEANFKSIVIQYIEETNNCRITEKYSNIQ
jgi:hypothetical protein